MSSKDPSVSSGGNETRSSILPKIDAEGDAGFMLPGYDFQAAVPGPASIGVRRGDSLGSVVDAARGVAYYVDMVGFGEASNPLSAGAAQPVKLVGINYFLKTNIKCPNNEPMYKYIEGIPQGTAFGKYVRDELAAVGLPGLRGLAPGMMEDVKAGLDPTDLLRSAFGDAYPDCAYVELPVGDAYGSITNPGDSEAYIKGRIVNDGSKYRPGDILKKDGRHYQRRWIQKTDAKGNPIYLSKAEYDALAQHSLSSGKGLHSQSDTLAAKAQNTTVKTEGFATEEEERLRRGSLALGLGFLALGAFLYARK
jgi:hypothetical protein